MTREEFIERLDRIGYSYEIEGEKIIITDKNRGEFFLDSFKTIPPVVEFKNKGTVWLRSLKTIPPGVEFKNEGDVGLGSLVGGWFSDWEGNIEGIDSNRLLNVMISKGLFER